ncbi:MAG: hypothetical protein LPL29_14510 [Alphaproteobacteria bacterium]|nr:hypothetical protein [Alphaproteobacteria bacterium]
MRSKCTFIGRIYTRLFKRIPPFEACCAIHDTEYVVQGTSRKAADMKFAVCMFQNRVPLWIVALVYYFVRAFGWVFWYRRQLRNWWRG